MTKKEFKALGLNWNHPNIIFEVKLRPYYRDKLFRPSVWVIVVLGRNIWFTPERTAHFYRQDDPINLSYSRSEDKAWARVAKFKRWVSEFAK